MEPDKRFIVGIDLGTTNSAVSYVDLARDGESYKIRTFQIPQLTGPGEFSRLPVLPSFLYIPGEYDISRDAISIPWKSSGVEKQPFAGAFARDHGSKVPARLVSSAKSWLCHRNVDRKARILPWGAGGEVYKVSPVQASAGYIEHIKNAWNHFMAEEEEDFLENQLLIVTVPASFDEVARELTLEAANLAGCNEVVLIEEPLAAFYSWLIQHGAHWGRHVKPDDLILVCDVGGGTTDFTLITLRESEGSPRFERIAVGDHLILGGDNVDLTLARRLETRFGKKRTSLSADRWTALCHQCRQAKEAILDGREESRKIVVMGEGGKLIAGTVSAELDRKEVEETVLEGFFPLAEPGGTEEKSARSGIAEFGLPYEREPAVTRHLGWFLEKHGDDVRKFSGRERAMPDLVLFNGGSLKPAIVRRRIMEAIRHWFGEKNPDIPRELENPTPDLAVSLGAAYYGLVKIGKGVRVGSGSPRSYFLGIAAKDEKGAPVDLKQAVCLVERGLDEGSSIELENLRFEVLANRPASFEIYSSSYRSGDKSGELVPVDDSLTPLPPLKTVIQFGKKSASRNVPVQIEAEFTETGTLAVWCRSLVSNHRWKLNFQLRDESPPPEVADLEIFDEDLVQQTLQKIEDAFADKSGTDKLESLVKEISSFVERPKEKWPLGLLRNIADALLKLKSTRNTSPVHESRWLNLTGFCTRPGFGEGFDSRRMAALWKIYIEGMRFSNNAQVRSEWWVLWRRVAGGLKPGQQRQFSQDLSALAAPKKGVKTKTSPQENLEIWMALANMELLQAKDKAAWGRRLLSELNTRPPTPQHFWALSRIGARTLLYGPADRIVAPDEVSRWIESVLEMDGSFAKPIASALAQMARKTGDRTRDLDQETVRKIEKWMENAGVRPRYARFLHEIVPVEKMEESAIFGESLPSGIVLTP